MSFARRRGPFLAPALAAAVIVLVAACGSGGSDPSQVRDAAGHVYDLSPQQPGRVHTGAVAALAAQVPAAVRARGELIVTGDSESAPPLRFYATDNHTVVGSEVDFASLVADILGLKLHLTTADWSQNFVSVDSGAADAFISNVTVTEERKEKYDFATYRLDNVALELPTAATWTYTDRKSLAGKRIGVGSGTNQEQLLLDWNAQNVAEGLPKIDIAYYQHTTDFYLALASGRLDGFLGPDPEALYHVATAHQTRIVGTFSGAGPTLQGQIAVLTKKDNGLIKPVQQALQYAIDHGLYQQVLARWGLQSEAVHASVINPPGLPKNAK